MNEFDLIQQYFSNIGPNVVAQSSLQLGVGDDCAIVKPSDGFFQAMSVDTLVADVHFPAKADPTLIAERALRVNLSDLAACGASPRWFTLALTLPEVEPNWLKAFSQGLQAAAAQFDIALVGGDTTRGPLSITVAVHGEVAPGQALLRSGGRPNQLVYVSGSLGDAAAALQFMNKKLSATQQDAGYFMQRYYRPEPRLQVGGVARMVSAAVDVSDGLIADLGHICKRSDIGATIDLERLPLSPALQRSCSEVQALELAATGGDDYELCLLVPETGRSQFEELAAQFGLPVTLIGNTNRHSGVQCLYKGSPHEFTTTGFTHF